MKGWVKFHRKILSSDLWLSEKFTRAQAWVDLIGLANHKDGFIRKRGIKISVKRGQVGWSEVKLSERWKWSRGKVRRFLEELKKDLQISKKPVQQNKFITSLITLTNYNQYQQDGTADGTADGQQTDSRQYRNKNEENGKNDKNDKKPPLSPKGKLRDYLQEKIIENNFIEIKDKIFEFFNYRMAMNKKGQYKTEKAINGLFRSLNGCREANMIPSECLEEAMERDWLTPDPSYFKNNRSGFKNRIPSRQDKNKQACSDFINDGTI